MSTELIDILKKQHDELRHLVSQIRVGAHKKEHDDEQIESFLNKFKEKLVEHLKLEDEKFYPIILKKLEEKEIPKSQIDNTKEFISQMKDIGKEVNSFLDKFDTPKKIKNDIKAFGKELDTMIAQLLLRIESEEESVYMYWYL